jgi:hypothetical protein
MDLIGGFKRLLRRVPNMRVPVRTAQLLGAATGVMCAQLCLVSMLRNKYLAPRLMQHASDMGKALQHGSLISVARTAVSRQGSARMQMAGAVRRCCARTRACACRTLQHQRRSALYSLWTCCAADAQPRMRHAMLTRSLCAATCLHTSSSLRTP